MLLVPAVAQAQVEIGMEGGLQISKGIGDAVTEFDVPVGTVRIGFPSDNVSFETLMSLNVLNVNSTLTLLNLTPGVNFPLGEGDAYLRVEGAMLLASGGGETETELGAGGAFGVKKAIDETDVSFRFEVGYDRFFDAEVNQFRVLLGLSVTVGG
jgi:hypothetical protein